MSKLDIITLILCIAFAIVAILAGKWVYESALNSNLPDWIERMLPK